MHLFGHTRGRTDPISDRKGYDPVKTRSVKSPDSTGTFEVFHGSNMRVRSPEYNRGREETDFGLGFYVTNDFRIARRRASETAGMKGGKPVVNRYFFERSKAERDMPGQVCIFKTPSVSWANYVIDNRLGRDTKRYEIVVGPIADARIKERIEEYRDNESGRTQLVKDLQASVIGGRDVFQVTFCSDEALSYLKYRGS